MKKVAEDGISVPYFCKKQGESRRLPCRHVKCKADPCYRIDDDTLIALATTASSRRVALSAEVALRRRYPSRHKALSALSPEPVEGTTEGSSTEK